MEEDILLAPNGKETNLTPELYEYVRTPEFKARYGDWEHGRSSTPLDGNGEPLVLWHGSPKSFDAFDFSHAGENTGLVEYTDRKSGEKVTSDSGRAMFFTDNRELAVSYAFLAKTQEYSEMCSCLSDCISLMHLSGLANSRIKSADDFREFVRKVRRGDDRELIDAFAKVDITKDHPVSRLDESLRNDIREKLIRIRSRYSERYQINRTGGLSNQLNNYVRQSEYYRYFAANFDRVCSNDMTVKTEFDTDLTQHNISFFGPDGNYGLSFHQEGTRIVMNGYGDGPVHVDTLSLVQRSQVLSRIRMDLNEGIGKFNRKIRESGYADAVHLYPVFLKSDNPLIHDYCGSSFPDKYKLDEKYDTAYVAARQVSRAVEQGKDAVVYANIRDPFLGTSYGVFSAEQIEILSKDMGLDVSPYLKDVHELLENMKGNSVELSEGSQRLGMKFRYSTNLNRCEDRLPGSSLKLWSSPPYVVTGLKLENSFPGKEGGFRHIESITIRNGKKKSFTFSGNQIDEKNRLVFTLKGVIVKYGIETGKAEFIMKKQDLQRTEESSATVKRKIR